MTVTCARLPNPALLELLRPEAALGWLVPWLRGPVADAAGAHLEVRGNAHARRHGALELYLGRTAPLELRANGRGGFTLHAHPTYSAQSGGLLEGVLDPEALAERGPGLRAYIERCAETAHPSLVGGEATPHAGMLRRYGLFADTHTPLLPLDSEVRLGFDSTRSREALGAEVRARLGMPAREAMPQKLDVLGLLGPGGSGPAGALALVELKRDAAGLGRAAWQAAAHKALFGALLAGSPGWPQEVLAPLARAKAAVGLLGAVPPPEPSPRLVPILAAPDGQPGWRARWLRQLDPVRRAAGDALEGLRLWRLDPRGALLEEQAL